MLEELLMYSLAGLIVYITASMFMYKQDVKILNERIKYMEMYIKERNES